TGGTSSNDGGSSGGDGGAVSTGGLASAGAGGAVSAPCTQHSDCTLYTDCCTCVALGPGESPPTSGCEGVGGMHCAVSACGSRGADTAECRDGQCVLVGSDCTASHAECSDPPPTCPADWAPNVIGGCWGVCIPQAKCGTVFVNTCDACSPDWTCVATEYPGSPRGFSCPVPPTTCSTHDCACVGASLCPSGYTCVDGPDDADVECRCPTC
ncbi:MAG: hypothetical protein JW940_38480, partial [Polyangiaceae bacterium]|nr:hypothetical protein [Polyangiaceae bacterium]